MALTQISTAGVKDDAVTAGKIPANAVGSSELADNAVDTAAIADDAVTSAKIADDSVVASQIQAAAVNESKLHISNSPTNGYFLSAQSGNAGGLTWAAVASDLVDDTSPQLGGTLDTNGQDVNFIGDTSGRDVIFDASGNQIRANDSAKLCAGSSSDLQIYHDGTDSYIYNTTGVLKVLDDSEVRLGKASIDRSYIKCIGDAQVELYYDNSKKLETTSSGVTVTGTLEATTYVAVPDQIYHVGDADTTIRFPAADTIALETAGSERFRVDSSGNVGIGTSSPTEKLQVFGGEIHFGDSNSSSNSIGKLIYGGNSGVLDFKAHSSGGNTQISLYTADGGNTSERLRINSSGNVGIGTTNPGQRLEVRQTNASHAVIACNRANSDTFAVALGNNSSNNGVISVNNSDLLFGRDSSGTFSERLRMLNNGGLTFNGDTAAANAIDDYEEGTYTPSITGDSGTATMSSSAGTYTKIGRLVVVNIQGQMSSKNGISGSVYVSLPFTVGDTLGNTSLESNGVCVFFNNLTTASSFLGLNTSSGTTKARFGGVESKQVTTATTLASGDIADNFDFRASIAYFV